MPEDYACLPGHFVLTCYLPRKFTTVDHSFNSRRRHSLTSVEPGSSSLCLQLSRLYGSHPDPSASDLELQLPAAHTSPVPTVSTSRPPCFITSATLCKTLVALLAPCRALHDKLEQYIEFSNKCSYGNPGNPDSLTTLLASLIQGSVD